MKKYLIMISSFVLTTVSTNQLVEGMISTNILKPIIKNENKELKEFTQLNDEIKIDFNEVENYFKDEKNKTNNKFNGISSSNMWKNKTQIDEAFAKSLEYTREFKQKNMSLNQIINKFKKEIPRFYIVYEREKNKILKNKKTTITNINNQNLRKNYTINTKINESKAKIEALEFWNKLAEFKIGFITTAAISAILAAGMWAASWVFGISIPWAVAATITAVTCTAVAEAINIYMVTNHPLIHKIEQNIEIGLSIAGITYAFFRDLYAIVQLSLVTIATTSVITAAGAAIFSVGVALFVWITHTDIFTQIENSKNEELKKWVEENKNGIVKIYEFEYKIEGGMWEEKTTENWLNFDLKKWTDYASSPKEFVKVFKYIVFTDLLAEAGGQGDIVKKESLLFPTSDILNPNTKELLRYNYSNWIGTTQSAYWKIWIGFTSDVIISQHGLYTYSKNAVYHVFLNVRFNDVYFAI